MYIAGTDLLEALSHTCYKLNIFLLFLNQKAAGLLCLLRCLWYGLFFTSCPLGNTSFIGMFLPDFCKRKTQYRNDTESSYMMQERSPYRANGTANLYDPCYRIFSLLCCGESEKRSSKSISESSCVPLSICLKRIFSMLKISSMHSNLSYGNIILPVYSFR